VRPGPGIPSVALTNHGLHWFTGITDVDVNGPVSARLWKMTCQHTGNFLTPGCDANYNRDNDNTKYTPYKFFMACFPGGQLKSMVDLTSIAVREVGLPSTTTGEILKWLGITVLITRFQFADRASLWSCNPPSKYVPSPNIGAKTGMARARYDSLLQHMVWSFQPRVREEGMSSESYSYMDACQRFRGLDKQPQEEVIQSFQCYLC